MKLENAVTKSLDERNTSYTQNRSRTLFSFKQCTEHGLLTIDLSIKGSRLSVVIFPGHVAPERRRPQAMEWIVRFNDRSPQGCFQMDPDDGVIYFELANVMEPSAKPKDISALVCFAVGGVCWSAPSLQEVLFHEADPKESLDSLYNPDSLDDDEDEGMSDEEFAALMDDLTRNSGDTEGDS